MSGEDFQQVPIVVLESHGATRSERSFRFAKPVDQIIARCPGEVRGAIEAVGRAVAAGGHAAGFISYEAAAGLDPCLRTKALNDLPLVWLGIFERRIEIAPGSFGIDEPFAISDWSDSIDPAAFARKIEQIREYIAAGDTYQVNYTFRRRAEMSGSPVGLFRALCRSQRADFCAYIDTGKSKIISASPEMFFRLEGRELTARPMKGTMPRGRWFEEDEAHRLALAQCPKNRAENIMIVDLMRNDLGRVAEVGTVSVPRLCDVERYETVLQMTSTVRGRLRPDVRLAELFAALFPSGSVTGAPKVRTMQIIEELEDEPRGIYTGAVGFISPGPEAVFNVAIRTVLLEPESDRERPQYRATFGVGGGITYDSDVAGEYEECRLKARFLATHRAEFELLETLLFEPPHGYFLKERHLARMENSAVYFGFRFDRDKAVEALDRAAAGLMSGRLAVRLLLDRKGEYSHTQIARPVTLRLEPPRVAFSSQPVDSRDPFLYHKTTRREIYTSRAQPRPDCFDVILLNERGEVTESTIANMAALIDGRLFTPPLDSGLLPGTYRADLLERGRLVERVLYPDDLLHGKAVFLINSVRKWIRVKLVP